MNPEMFHDMPVDSPTLWQRPEHLAELLSVSVRTLRKWVAKGRAERQRNYRGQVYYRLTAPIGPVGGPVRPTTDPGLVTLPGVVVGDLPQHAEQLDQLQQQIAAARQEAAEFRSMTEDTMRSLERISEENTHLRRELQYQQKVTSVPWWARRRRREITMPMVDLEQE